MEWSESFCLEAHRWALEKASVPWPCDASLQLFMLFIPLPPQVDEIYHDESLGTNINIVLVRMIMVGYRQVRFHFIIMIAEGNFMEGDDANMKGKVVYICMYSQG